MVSVLLQILALGYIKGMPFVGTCQCILSFKSCLNYFRIWIGLFFVWDIVLYQLIILIANCILKVSAPGPQNRRRIYRITVASLVPPLKMLMHILGQLNHSFKNKTHHNHILWNNYLKQGPARCSSCNIFRRKYSILQPVNTCCSLQLTGCRRTR